MKLILKKPLTVAGKNDSDPLVISELKFREEICAGDLRGIKLKQLEDIPTDDMLKIAGRLCAQPDAVMNRLSLEDFAAVMEIVGGFFGAEKTESPPSSSSGQATTTTP